MTYQDALNFLFQLQKTGMKLGLSSMVELLDGFKNPQEGFRAIHVGGTNGKGSTCSTLSSILQSSGFKVGLYTSPHLIDFTERIRVNSSPIPQKDVIRLTLQMRNSIKHQPTFFEFTTALAFCYFREQEVDLAVIEVGLGGRLDSTNVLNPLLSIITNIDLDHQEYLGKTLLDIGKEKAGIIKKRVPVISGIVQPEIQDLVGRTAFSFNAPYYQAGRDFSVRFSTASLHSTPFHYQGIHHQYTDLSIPLLGKHQRFNAALAIGASEILQEKGYLISEKALRSGLANVSWPGRIEIVQRDPLMILDGAHNPAGAHALSEFLKNLAMDGKRFLVLGIMKDKDIHKIGEELFPWADEIILTRTHFERAASPKELLSILPPTSKPVHLIESIAEVLNYLKSTTSSQDVVCFTGSLYTIGEVKAALEGFPIHVPLYG